MEVHSILGKGLSEVVYKDALEYELVKNKIPFSREVKFQVEYKDVILNHHYYADFIVYENIILEIKAKKDIIEEHIAQTLNYMNISKSRIGLIINFGEDSLTYKRLIL
ncbi:MAG: GxxExxY protein [Bacteroidetes bacterium HGW-Bacteroidetes-12]|nr:MAG: GxxExxY protein [Bacteroidetes bacterium HGW-Bacteroidetes-12]